MTDQYKRLKVGMPVLSRSERDPTGIEPQVDKCERDLSSRLDAIKRSFVKQVMDLPYKRLESAGMAFNAFYAYEVNETELLRVYAGLDETINEYIMQTVQENSWFYTRYIEPAMRAGSAAAYFNIARQIKEYSLITPTLSEFLVSERYRRRVALVKSRQFELMKGLAGEMKNDLSRILAEGIGRGLNPRDIAKTISEQMEIEKGRANRIAQTEITGALRRARWDENDHAEERLGIRFMELHLSALKPTTRITHAERHGKLYTTEEVRKWYSEGANAINCYCSQTAVAVDESGAIISEALAKRITTLRTRGDDFLETRREQE